MKSISLSYNYIVFNNIESKLSIDNNGYYTICLKDLEGFDDIEVVNLIAQANHPVATDGLINLNTGRGQSEHARGAVFQLGIQVVVQRHVKTQQGHEGFVDADTGHVEHGTGDGRIGLHVVDKAQSVHVLHVSAVGAVGTDAVDALVSMGDVNALEVLAEPWNLTESAETQRPVGQHLHDGGEDAQSASTHARVVG